MQCKICGKPIKKHDETDLAMCLSKQLGDGEMLTVTDLVGRAAVQGYIEEWGQPYIDSTVLLVRWVDSQDPVKLNTAEVLQELGSRILEAKETNAIRDDTPEDIP